MGTRAILARGTASIQWMVARSSFIGGEKGRQSIEQCGVLVRSFGFGTRGTGHT
jgi:hypothetical protein